MSGNTVKPEFPGSLSAISSFDSQIPASRQIRSFENHLLFKSHEWGDNRFRIKLYRFMHSSIPIINSVVWTWSRLAAAPGRFVTTKDENEVDDPEAVDCLRKLYSRINRINFGRSGEAGELLHPFFHSLFLDGAIFGRLLLAPDYSGIERFEFIDLSATELKFDREGMVRAKVAVGDREIQLSGDNLYYFGLNADLSNPQGKSILKAVPFIAYVEQQLIDDMRRTMHNSGYHRMHIKIKPPEKRAGESDESYADRANRYFDSTVAMIRDIEPEDNPVTWEDVAIEYIGPRNQGGVRTNNWFLNHRAMIEAVCAGTNLAPFLLGYSYNSTTNWAQFKYDLVMRQVETVQQAAVNFLNWLANIELSLKGFKLAARWEFDNRFSALARERMEVTSGEISGIIKLYEAGLIDRETAALRAARLI